MSERLCIHAIIHGRVQGVSYRAWTVANARHRLTGWVRNRRDGTVEALFCGLPADVEEMLKLCEQGPMAARVTKVERMDWEDEIPSDFCKIDTV